MFISLLLFFCNSLSLVHFFVQLFIITFLLVVLYFIFLFLQNYIYHFRMALLAIVTMRYLQMWEPDEKNG